MIPRFEVLSMISFEDHEKEKKLGFAGYEYIIKMWFIGK